MTTGQKHSEHSAEGAARNALFDPPFTTRLSAHQNAVESGFAGWAVEIFLLAALKPPHQHATAKQQGKRCQNGDQQVGRYDGA